MNFFLEKLSEQYTDDYILLICDGAAWHKSTELIIPENIELFFIPPYTVSLLKPRLMCYNMSGDENEEIRDNH